jgi:hypothetical protein
MSANENTCPLSVSMTTEDPPRDLPLAPKKKKQEAKIAVRTWVMIRFYSKQEQIRSARRTSMIRFSQLLHNIHNMRVLKSIYKQKRILEARRQYPIYFISKSKEKKR